MDNHNIQPISESEQMYLLTLAILAEDGMPSPIALTALAQARSIQPVSVNQMVRKLADSGLVTYLPYKGVELTSAGQAIALRILRYRRLWEVFFVEKLGLPLVEADVLACRLEHLMSDEVAERLASYLGDPQVSPQGKPIPQQAESPAEPGWLRLSDAPFEANLQLMQANVNPTMCAFLADEGLRPGAMLHIIGAGASGALLIDVDGRSIRLAERVTQNILVLPRRADGPAALAGERNMHDYAVSTE